MCMHWIIAVLQKNCDGTPVCGKYVNTRYHQGNIAVTSRVRPHRIIFALWALGYRAYIEDCSHNFDDTHRAALTDAGLTCIEQNDLEDFIDNVCARPNLVAAHEVTPRNFKTLMGILYPTQSLVNLALFRCSSQPPSPDAVRKFQDEMQVLSAQEASDSVQDYIKP